MNLDVSLRDGHLEGSVVTGASIENGAVGRRAKEIRGGREKPRSRKKTWGIFYTPEALIHHLTQWAVRSAADTILEPSFGGCGFLEACATRLAMLGAPKPWDQMAGCDIDLRAFTNLPPRFRDPTAQRRFLLANFLETRPPDYPSAQYSVVIGNPPYVSRHNMRQYQLETARTAIEERKVPVPLSASLWAYFVMHSLAFLQAGGKMAWVLPRSLTQGDYGKKIIELLSAKFECIDILCLSDRAFVGVGAEEFVDILLCEGYCATGCDTAVRPHIHHLAKIPPATESLVPSKSAGARSDESPREQALSPEQVAAWHVLRQTLAAVRLGNFAEARIGIVTGATDFFVLRRSQLQGLGVSEAHCRFILTRFGIAQGLHLDESDALALSSEDARVLLVDARKPENEAYWMKFPVHQIAKIKTFKKRSSWKDPDDGVVPDAFFPPLIHQYPRLVINTVRSNCTNTVHRVLFKPEVSVLQRWAFAVCLLSTPTQLSCELIGRQCGSGGLKIEPSDFLKLEVATLTPLHLQTVARAAAEIDAALRCGEVDRARDLADEWLFSGVVAAPRLEIRAQARAALQRLQLLRFRP